MNEIRPAIIESAENIINFYKPYFRSNLSDIESGKSKFYIPICPANVVINLCETVKNLFMNEPMLLKFIDSSQEIVIIGDIHGHVLDLFRTLSKTGMPTDKTLLFLGDIVDRGDFSTETITIIFALKILYPSNVFIIRGNHEFSEMARQCGFSNELTSLYNGNSSIEIAFMEAFSYIPIGALIGNHSLCIHGGIGPKFYKIEQLETIQRPLNEYHNDLVSEILWSDPSRFGKGFEPSTRGIGYFFGPDALEDFLVTNKLKYVVRGHECVENGVEMQLGRKMFTVFGASNYCKLSPNKSGILVLKSDDPNYRTINLFGPLNHPKRSSAVILTSDNMNTFSVRKPGVFGLQPPSLPKKLPHLLDNGKTSAKAGSKQQLVKPTAQSLGGKPPFVASQPNGNRKFPAKKLPMVNQKRFSSCPK